MSNNEAPAGRRRRHHCLSFVCVNDVYSFDDVDSAADAAPRGGWSRAATLMKRLRRKNGSGGRALFDLQIDNGDSNETVLTVVNGDVLGGCSLLQYSKGSVAIEVMNCIPIDVAVLGNHEFDYGDEALIERVKESNFVWLGSNVYYPPQSDAELQQQEVESNDVEMPLHYFPGIHGNGKVYPLPNGLKLGVFGLVTKLTPKISSPSEMVVFDPDILSVARRTAQRLRADGAQVIVAITHMSEVEDELLAADKASGVDLILGGHEHEPLAAMVHRSEDKDDTNNAKTPDSDEDEKHNEGGVLVFKCGMNAYWVGKVDLNIIEEDQKVTSISTSWAMHAVTSQIPEDPTVSDIVRRHREKTDRSAMISCFGQEIADSVSLDDVLATIGEETDNGNGAKPAALPLDTRMSSVRRREATGGNLVADAMHWTLTTNLQREPPLPMLAMINGGFIRGDRIYKPGSIFTVREVLAELPFPRTMKVLQIDGCFLKEAMAQQLKGSSRGPTGAFPHLSSNAQLKYGVGGSDSAEEHISIHSFTVDGIEVADDQTYIIAVTCFVADGNEGCSSWLNSTRIDNPAWDGVNMSCVLLKYLQSTGVIRPVLEDRVILV